MASRLDRSASIEIQLERLLHPRHLFFGLADGQLVEPLLQLQVGDGFVELFVVELEERFALANFFAVLDDFDDFVVGPGFGAKRNFVHLAGDEHAVERDVDFETLRFDLVRLALRRLRFGVRFSVVWRRPFHRSASLARPFLSFRRLAAFSSVDSDSFSASASFFSVRLLALGFRRFLFLLFLFLQDWRSSIDATDGQSPNRWQRPAK